MIRFIRLVTIALIYLLVSLNTFAQSVPTSLFACLDGNGNLYGVTPTGKLGEACSGGDLPVSLGSAGEVNASNGLVGTIVNGIVDIRVAEGLAIPPSCPPGQIPISDGQGAWICTIPNLTGNSNPAANVWIIPRWEYISGSGRWDVVNFVNPGRDSGSVICYTMTGLGGWIPNVTEEHIIGGGSRGKCAAETWSERTRYPRYYDRDVTWLLIVSNVPIIPSANFYDRGVGGGQIQAYPVDCQYPEGYEAACDLAID